jgi:2-polyprenyl-3-methyl-5-hydroxy-6-metoxy-1,4-benzoquinol methylase
MNPDPSLDIFNADADQNEGYLYTTNTTLSSRLANRRNTDSALAVMDFHSKRVIDIGSGDGIFSEELVELGDARTVRGIDPAERAVAVARRRIKDDRLAFDIGNAYDLPYPPHSFDIAFLRSILHHVERPVDVLREALRVASTIVVVEPNGYNLGLKLLEKVSPYHRQHGEKSYAPHRLNRWVEDLGGRIIKRQWVGLVPMFSPDWIAKPAKRVEPLLEHLPGLRAVGCSQYVFSAAAGD